MITVTRLNGKPFVVNAELIRTVEENPDTTITLLNGDHMIVKEPMAEIVRKAIEYGRHLRRISLYAAPVRPQTSTPPTSALAAILNAVTMAIPRAAGGCRRPA